MMKKARNSTRIFSLLMSLIMTLSLINLPTLKASAEGGVDGFVERCYTVTLDRGSDPDGFADWKDQLLNGKSVGVNIAYGFLFSKEYTNKSKSDDAYVKDLYKLFMDREPDQAGFNDWVGKLNDGKSREEVFAGFANSQEFYNICESYGITAGYFAVGYDRNQVNNVNLFVERLYQTCLGRRGDRGGQKDWVNKLLKKEITGVECARCFIQSKEYVNKCLSDDEYVENMYKAMMGRASDAGGKTNWLNALSSGKTRDEVFAGFANSKEFGDICSKYKIDKGSYTAKDIGTTNNNNNNNNQNNNNQNNNNNNNNSNNNSGNNNNAEKAIVNYLNTGNCKYKDDTQELEKPAYNVGDVIKLGKYEQDGNTANGKEDIEWVVISVRDNNVLVVSKYVLEYMPYNTEKVDTTWESSSIRKWLNNDFLTGAFSKEEQNNIPLVPIENPNNLLNGTDGGNDTQDKLFLLDINQIQYAGCYQWFDASWKQGLSKELIAEPTAYCIQKGAVVSEFTEADYNEVSKYYPKSVIGKKGTYCWMRNVGKTANTACYVTSGGNFCASYNSSVDTKYGIRPAMYLNYKEKVELDQYAEPVIPKLKAGDTFTFGRYEQDNNPNNGKEPIEWIVLEADDSRALVLSRYALDCKAYYAKDCDIDWSDSPVRSWLNNTFMSEAFTYAEEQHIPTVVIKNPRNTAWQGSMPGKDTNDQLFCLSHNDLVKYFGDYQFFSEKEQLGYNENFLCSPTPYAISKGAGVYVLTQDEYNRADRYNWNTKERNLSFKDIYSEHVIGRVCTAWWVRDMGGASNVGCSIDSDGYGGPGFIVREIDTVSVRPAMYIEY